MPARPGKGPSRASRRRMSHLGSQDETPLALLVPKRKLLVRHLCSQSRATGFSRVVGGEPFDARPFFRARSQGSNANTVWRGPCRSARCAGCFRGRSHPNGRLKQSSRRRRGGRVNGRRLLGRQCALTSSAAEGVVCPSPHMGPRPHASQHEVALNHAARPSSLLRRRSTILSSRFRPPRIFFFLCQTGRGRLSLRRGSREWYSVCSHARRRHRAGEP